MLKYIVVLVLLNFLKSLYGQQTYPLKLMSVTTMDGHVFPNKIDIATGEDAIFQLLTLPEAFTDCLLTTPQLDETVKIVPKGNKGRYEYWNPVSSPTGCGVRIKSIKMEDKGRWKLLAHNSKKKAFQSFIDINVVDRDEQSPMIYLREGTPAAFNISTRADYCEIRKLSYLRSDAVYDKCEVKLDNVVRSLAGTWSVQTGIKGQVKEVSLSPKIIIAKEELLVGINYTDSKISMYCNFQNTKNTKFRYCRFVRGDSKVALHLSEGLSDGKFSYYGNGLKYGECGLTIEMPDQSDLTVWKCHIGIIVNNVTYSTRDSVIYLPKDRSARSLNNFRDIDIEDETIGLAGRGYPVTIFFQANRRLKYCYFRHPNGTTFSVDRKYNENVIKTVGELDAGECGLTVVTSSINDTGIWTCHMADYETIGMDQIHQINVRIAYTPLVALQEIVHTEINAKITLKCIMTSPMKALQYCRFMLPDGSGFNLNEDNTQDNAINNMYWYDGKGLSEGDCQVTIKNVMSDHFGNWTCGGKLMDTNELELYDTFRVQEGTNSYSEDGVLTTGASIGIGVGVLVVLILVVGGTVFYRRRVKKRTQTEAEPIPFRDERPAGNVRRARNTRSNAPSNERSEIFLTPSTSYSTSQPTDNIEMETYTEPTNEEHAVQVTSS